MLSILPSAAAEIMTGKRGILKLRGYVKSSDVNLLEMERYSSLPAKRTGIRVKN